jgi:hypothetical protein
VSPRFKPRSRPPVRLPPEVAPSNHVELPAASEFITSYVDIEVQVLTLERREKRIQRLDDTSQERLRPTHGAGTRSFGQTFAAASFP